MTTFSQKINQSIKETPQSKPIKGRESEMHKNAAGGYVFTNTDTDMMKRMYILGITENIYYSSQQTAEILNGQIIEWIQKGLAIQLIDLAEELFAFRNDAPPIAPTRNKHIPIHVYALIIKHSNLKDRSYLYDTIPKRTVIKNLSQMLQFVSSLELTCGKIPTGSGVKRMMEKWIKSFTSDDWEYQVAKYRGKSIGLRNFLRLYHPRHLKSEKLVVNEWAIRKELGKDFDSEFEKPSVLQAIDSLTIDSSKRDVISAIQKHRLSWEMIPNVFMKDGDVLMELAGLNSGNVVNLTAFFRNIPRYAAAGVINSEKMIERLRFLANENGVQSLAGNGIHPFNTLLALNGYRDGRSRNLQWNIEPSVSRLLEKIFYNSFKAVPAIDKRVFHALDVSSSMTWGAIAGLAITPLEAEAVMLKVAIESGGHNNVIAKGFTTSGSWYDNDVLQDIPFDLSYDELLKYMKNLDFGGTDCALPFQYALEREMFIDTFIIHTDNETWSGKQHPSEILREYRRRVNPDAKVVMIAYQSNRATINDPNDNLALDVVGFSGNAFETINQFVQG